MTPDAAAVAGAVLAVRYGSPRPVVVRLVDGAGGGERLVAVELDAATLAGDVSVAPAPDAAESAVVVTVDADDRRVEVAGDGLPEPAAVATDRLRRVLDAVLAEPASPVAALPVLTDDELAAVTAAAAGTRTEPAAPTVPDLLARAAARWPDVPALEAADGRTVSFAALHDRARALGEALAGRGVAPEESIVVCGRRVPATFIAMLGVAHAGAAFVPVDPAYPPARIRAMVEASGARVAVVDDVGRRCLPAGLDLLTVDEASSSPSPDGATRAGPDGVAARIFTSGSTAVPKGVELEHAALVNLGDAMARVYGMSTGTRILQYAALGFDATTADLLETLASGATLCLAAEHELLPGAALEATLTRRRITSVTLPPSVVASLHADGIPTVATLAVAGERCPPALVEAFAPGRRFLNAYGPTETTVCATVGPCRPGEPVTIGTPLDNLTVHVVDELGLPVPVGVPGEIVVDGFGVARGYVGGPFPGTPRRYRTGDRARRRADGRLEFLGRRDDQLKVHGVRVEPAEILAALLALPGIRQAVVVVNPPDETGRLAAFVVPDPEGRVALRAVRDGLRDRLPNALVPAVIVPVGALPLTPNGKTDTDALARMALPEVTGAGGPPRAGLEAAIAALWEDTLGIEGIGRDDDFFDLGGQSLLAAQVAGVLNERHGSRLAAHALYDAPTVALLAEAVGSAPGPDGMAGAVRRLLARGRRR